MTVTKRPDKVSRTQAGHPNWNCAACGGRVGVGCIYNREGFKSKLVLK